MNIKEFNLFLNLFKKINISNIKYISILLLFLFFIKYIQLIKNEEIKNISFYREYIKDCRKYKKYNRKSIINKSPFISICLPTYNMEKYIKKAVISIINQTFQDFEIIIINDFSNDKTKFILEQLQLKDYRIKIINHYKNYGVYTSRVDGVLNSKGNFIILMDPDDMLLNPNLFENLYYYYLKYNLDMIEFTIFHYEEKKKHLYIKKDKNHFHNYSKTIIYQPELFDILFYDFNIKNYSSVKCRAVWNKIIRKEVLLKTINYLGRDYYKKFFITAEDTLINILNFQFAQNYSNINYPGYMYNIREISMTHGKRNKQKQILYCYNYLLYFKKLLSLFKDFKKDINLLFYELKEINFLLLQLRNLDKNRKLEIIKFYQEIKKEKNISKNFNEYINELLK